MRIRVLDIVEGTSVDGPGLRTSIYLAGCHHRCPGCHNPESWAMDGGREASVDELLDTIRYNDFNVTLSGGDRSTTQRGGGTVPAHQAGTGKNRLVFYGFHLGRDTSRPGIAASAAMDATWWSKDASSRLCATRSCASAVAPTSASSTLQHQEGKQYRWN